MESKEYKFTIGRKRDCDIVLADKSVSRLHAELTIIAGGRLFLTDCKSRNGTALFQDGKWQSIRQELISPTDTLQFGDVEMTVKELLESIQLKFPTININLNPHFPDPPPPRPWGPEDRLVRCKCGEVKAEGKACPTCGE